MRSRRIAQIIMVIAAVGAGAGRSDSQERTSRGQIATVPADSELVWPLPASARAYATIDGQRMKQHVEELVAISRKSRDAGNPRGAAPALLHKFRVEKPQTNAAENKDQRMRNPDAQASADCQREKPFEF